MKFWGRLALLLLILIVGILFENPTFSLVTSLSAVIIGVILKINYGTLAIITLPFQTYLSINGYVYNFTPAFLVVVISICSPSFIRSSLALNNKNNFMYKLGIWGSSLLLILTIGLFANNSSVMIRDFSEIGKLFFALLFFMWAFVLFSTSKKSIRFEWLKIWVFVSFFLSSLSALSFILLKIGFETALSDRLTYFSVRLQGSYRDPNLFSLYLLVSFVFLFIYSRQISYKQTVIMLAPLALAFSYSSSRGALIALVVMVTTGAVLFFKNWKTWVEWLKFSGLFFLTFYIAPKLISLFFFLKFSVFRPLSTSIENSNSEFSNIPYDRPLSTSIENSNSEFSNIPYDLNSDGEVAFTQRIDVASDSRFSIWKEAINLWKEDPIFGIGYGNFAADSHAGGTLIHNTFLSLLVEGGIFTFVLFVFPIVMILVSLIRQRTFTSRALSTAAIGIVIMMNAYNLNNVPLVWMVFGIFAAFAYTQLPTKIHRRQIIHE